MMIAGFTGLLLLSIAVGMKHSVSHKQQKIEQRACQMGYDLHFSD